MATAIDPTGRGRKTRTITATDPATGATLTRSTDRIYWAAVVFTSSAGKVTAAAWAGRPDLAAKALAQRGGEAQGYRLAPVTADPWATPEPTPAAVAPEPTPTPADPLAAAAAELAAAVITPATPEAWAIARAQAQAARAQAQAAPEAWAIAQAQAARVTLPGEPAATAPVTPAGPEPTLPTLERVAPDAVARLGFSTLNPATEGLTEAPADCYPPAQGVAAHRAAAAAGRPVSLAALARDLGRGLGLATGGRIPGPAAAPTGDPLEGLPWDPGTPAARARVAEQGRRAAILWPVAQAIRGAGHPLPASWASDGPVMAGQVGPVTALAALPAALLESAAAALAALPPVTPAQAQALELLRDALAR